MEECYGCRILDDNNKVCIFIENGVKNECPCTICIVKPTCGYFGQSCDEYRLLVTKCWKIIAKRNLNANCYVITAPVLDL